MIPLLDSAICFWRLLVYRHTLVARNKLGLAESSSVFGNNALVYIERSFYPDVFGMQIKAHHSV